MKEEPTIEQMIAVIMRMKDLLGEFSVDMYYNDLAEPNERYVVKLKVHEPAPDSSRTAEYFRCSSFKEGLDKLLHFLISKIFKRELEYYLYILNDKSLTYQDKVEVLEEKIKERIKNM